MASRSVDISSWQAQPRYYKSAITPEVDYLTQSYQQTQTSQSKLRDSRSQNPNSNSINGRQALHSEVYTNSEVAASAVSERQVAVSQPEHLNAAW